jgi:hypothetical protein
MKTGKRTTITRPTLPEWGVEYRATLYSGGYELDHVDCRTLEEAEHQVCAWEREYKIKTTICASLTNEQITALCRGRLASFPAEGQDSAEDVAARALVSIAQSLVDAQRRPGSWERGAFASLGMIG